MEKIEKYISLNNSTLSYFKIGKGTNTQLCFHGFGQGKEVFEDWNENIENVQIYSFDLFFHGKSEWKEKGERLNKSFLKHIFEQFFKNERIEEFSIISFSIGARYAWTLLELFPEKIQNVHFISPDGVKENIWFRLASKSFLGNLFFKKIAHSPYLLPKLVKITYYTKIISKNQFKLAQSQILNLEKRKQVYNTWTLLAKQKYQKKVINAIVRNYQIQFYLYFSKNDKIIPPKNLQNFIKNIPCQIFKLKSPHHKILKEAKFLWRNVEINNKIV